MVRSATSRAANAVNARVMCVRALESAGGIDQSESKGASSEDVATCRVWHHGDRVRK